MGEASLSLRDEELARIARDLAAKLFKEAETKRVFKEALNEWLDKKFEAFGKWSAVGISAAIFAAVIVVVMWSTGYHK